MIKFREHKYNFVPIEPYRQWVEDIPQRSFGIFHHVGSPESREQGSSGKGNKTRSSSREEDAVSMSMDDRRHGGDDEDKKEQQQVVAYDDKLLWEISLRLEPRV
jgi:hypothetical protein